MLNQGIGRQLQTGANNLSLALEQAVERAMSQFMESLPRHRRKKRTCIFFPKITVAILIKS